MATVELDPTAQTPRRRGRRQAIKLLVVANPDRSSSEEDTPVDIYFNNNSTAPSRPAAIRAPSPRRATSPPPTSRPDDSLQSSPGPGRIIVSVTSDAENFVVVDVTQTNSETIRERILSKLHIPDDLHASFAIYRTELGGLTIGSALNDNSLLIDCQHFGDDKGTLKFLAQRSDAPLDSPDADIPAPLPPMPPSLSSFSPGTMGPPSSHPLVEYKRPSPSSLYRPPPLSQTPQEMTWLPALLSGRYTQQQRPQSASDALPPSLRSGPRPRAERLLTKYDRPLLSDLYRSSTSSQPIVPVTQTQPAHVPPQTKVISRDFGAAVREEDDEDESDENSGILGQVAKQKSVLSASGAGSTAAATTVAPLVRRTATRRKGLRLSIDGSRPSNDTFMPSTLPLEVRKKTAANRVNGSGNRGEIPSRSPLLPYQNSSAPSSSSSNTHPQTEEVNEKLDQSFPNHDLGNPIINIPSGATSSVTEAPPIAGSDGPRINGPGVRQHKKSIRVVAAERKKMLDRTNAAKVQQSAVGDYATNYVASGGFGDIWKGQLRDGTAVAIKVWRFRALNEDPGKDIKRAMREIYNWSQLNHDNIQKLLGVVVFDERLGMVSKWMEGGNLQSYLENNPRIYRYPLCIQVAQGVEYLHDSNMIHGDLKAINVLVSSDHKLKLTDFDYSIMAESTLQFSQTTRMGGGTLRLQN
ncbi:tyrosine kinase domain protein, partial [Rhizoctonia solani AG-3 Rhs1AP]